MPILEVTAVAIASMAFLAVLTRRSELALGLVFVTLVLPATMAFSQHPAIEIVRWFALLAANVALVLRWLANKRSPFHVVRGGVASLAALSLFSAMWSVDPAQTVGRALTFMLMISLAAQVAFDMRNTRVAIMWRGPILSFGLIGAIAMAEFVSTGQRSAAVFENPNYLGILCAGMTLLAASHAVESRRKVWIVPAILNGIGVVASQSRSAAVATGIGLLVLAILRRSAGVSSLMVGAVLVLGAGSLFLVLSERGIDGSSREEMWSRFPAVLVETPMVGHGFGTTELVTVGLFSDLSSSYGEGTNFHSSWLNLGSDLGIVGLVVLALVVVQASQRFRSVVARRRQVVAATIVGLLVSASFESWFFSAGAAAPLLFWTVLFWGLTEGAPRWPSPSRGEIDVRCGVPRTAVTRPTGKPARYVSMRRH
jgi:exopolysaccharide production protein ExoQ